MNCNVCEKEFPIEQKRFKSLKCPECFRAMKAESKRKNLLKNNIFLCNVCKEEKTSEERKADTKVCKKCNADASRKYYENKKKAIANKGVIIIKETEKICSKCNEEKSIDQYHFDKNRGTFRAACKNCTQIDRKNYYNENKKIVIKTNIAYEKQRIHDDSTFKLVKNLRCSLTHILKSINCGHKFKTLQIIGCSKQHLKGYIEAKFKDGMTWDNHGEWHIDHIKPVSLFDVSDEEQQKKCFHYTNLQPLWAKDNIQKSNKYDECSET